MIVLFLYIFVFLQECLDGLVIKLDGIYIDVIFGCGGYLGEIFKQLGSNGCLIVFDCDFQVIEVVVWFVEDV